MKGTVLPADQVIVVEYRWYEQAKAIPTRMLLHFCLAKTYAILSVVRGCPAIDFQYLLLLSERISPLDKVQGLHLDEYVVSLAFEW